MTFFTLLSILTAFLLPSPIIYLALRFAPRGRARSYNGLIGMSVAATLLGIVCAFVLDNFFPSGTSAWSHVTHELMTGTFPEQASKLGAFFLWLSSLNYRSARDAIVGCVIAAMVFEIVGDILIFVAASHGDLSNWVHAVAGRSIVATLPSAADALIVGIWVAGSLDKPRVRRAVSITGSVVVVLATSVLWAIAAVAVDRHWSDPDRWFWALAELVPLILVTIACQLAAIGYGVGLLRAPASLYRGSTL